jgi:hypothetical protein
MKKSIARPTGKLQTAEVSVKKHDGSKSTWEISFGVHFSEYNEDHPATLCTGMPHLTRHKNAMFPSRIVDRLEEKDT